MLAENLQHWAERERLEGERIGILRGRLETAQATARNLIALGMLNDGQIAQATGLSVAQVEALRADK
jgi:predicted transposase YdaD